MLIDGRLKTLGRIYGDGLPFTATATDSAPSMARQASAMAMAMAESFSGAKVMSNRTVTVS